MDNSIIRQLPASIEAEQALLGSIIVSPDSFDKISGIISTEDFYLDEHKHIYSLMLRLLNRGRITTNSHKVENELNKINGRTNKHHSAPIKMLSYYNLNRNKLSENKEKNKEHIFETHLLKKLIQDENDKVHKCNHPTCDLAYRTKKQKISHHSKMDPECQKDSILFLELLSKERDIINKMNKEFKIQHKDKINKINRKMLFIKKNFSFYDYAHMICKGSIMLEEDENNIIN
jgi:replicative DNA helicase